VLEQFDDFLAGLGLHLDEDLFGVILGEIGEKVGGGVRIHLLDDVGGALRVERLDDGFLNFGVRLLQEFRPPSSSSRVRKDGFARRRGRGLLRCPQCRRMELGQTCVRDFQLDAAGGIGFDEIDESPGDGAGREFSGRGVCQSGYGGEAAQEAANRATGTDTDRSNPALWYAGFRGAATESILEFDIIDADNFAAIDVDDLLIEQVTIKEK